MFWAKRIAVVGALALSGTAAGAASVTFDFTTVGPVSGPTLSFSQGGLNLVVSAGVFNTTTGVVTMGGGPHVGQGMGAGLGERFDSADNAKLDGSGHAELLLFSFGSKIHIESVTFARIDTGSKVTGFLNGVMMGTTAVTPFMDVSANNFNANNFGVGAGDAASAFRVAGITVSSVPLPAGGLLLGSALLGLSRLGRKRSV